MNHTLWLVAGLPFHGPEVSVNLNSTSQSSPNLCLPVRCSQRRPFGGLSCIGRQPSTRCGPNVSGLPTPPPARGAPRGDKHYSTPRVPAPRRSLPASSARVATCHNFLSGHVTVPRFHHSSILRFVSVQLFGGGTRPLRSHSKTPRGQQSGPVGQWLGRGLLQPSVTCIPIAVLPLFSSGTHTHSGAQLDCL